MEITWYGETCIRLRGREGVVAADAFRSVVGPTGRGLTADIATYSHPEGRPAATSAGGRNGRPANHDGGVVRPTSLEPALVLYGPGEYEVHQVLITGVRTFRDDVKGSQRGANTSFVFELDGLHTVHLGDIGHLLNEDMLREIGRVDLVCVPIGASLSAARTAELVAQLDANLVVPLAVGDDHDHSRSELDRFLHEMSVQHPTPVPRLAISISTVPQETTVVILEARGRS
jgi:L-ascorbate metabolism protein UlaG (beta-lactamase superfamily)